MDREEVGKNGELDYPGMSMSEKIDEVENNFESQVDRDIEIMEDVSKRKSYDDMLPISLRSPGIIEGGVEENNLSDFINNPNDYNEKKYLETAGKTHSDEEPDDQPDEDDEEDYDEDEEQYEERYEEDEDEDEEYEDDVGKYRDDEVVESYGSEYEDEPEEPNVEEIILRKPSDIEKTDISKLLDDKAKYVRRNKDEVNELTLSGEKIKSRSPKLIDEVNSLLVKRELESNYEYNLRYNFTQWILENPKVDLPLGKYFDAETIIMIGTLLMSKYRFGIKYNQETEKKLTSIINVTPDIYSYFNTTA